MKALSLYWYRTEANFGDAFSPYAVRLCFGREVVPAGKWNCHLVAEGSVLGFALLRSGVSIKGVLNRMFRPPLHVWGSGLLFPLGKGVRRTVIRKPRFLAVRGIGTLTELKCLGLLGPKDEVALGDPGVFFSEVMTAKPIDGRHGRGLVLHACSWKNGEADAFAHEHPEIRLIDPRREPEAVVADISSCAEIFSSSLHGLIAADSLGIPNRWVSLMTPYGDAKKNRFKFDDYYSALGEVREPCAMNDVCHLPPLDPVPAEKLLSCRQALRQAAAGLCCP